MKLYDDLFTVRIRFSWCRFVASILSVHFRVIWFWFGVTLIKTDRHTLTPHMCISITYVLAYLQWFSFASNQSSSHTVVAVNIVWALMSRWYHIFVQSTPHTICDFDCKCTTNNLMYNTYEFKPYKASHISHIYCVVCEWFAELGDSIEFDI